jgi:putative ABC transport system substrate-binding protein
MTTRRQFLVAVSLGAIAPGTAFAQSRPVKIGMLSARPLDGSAYAGGVVRRLADLGYRSGAGAVLEFRSADGFADRYPKHARELIGLKCDIYFAIGPELPARALQDARAPAPIVFLAVDYDPLDKGIIGSLSRPDRNTTGVYVPANALAGKRLEIMKEVVPAAKRFLIFSDSFSRDQLAAARKAAEVAGVRLIAVDFASKPYDFVGAFETGAKAQAQGFVTLSSPEFATHAPTLAALALKHRIPSIGTVTQQVNAGFLLSFAADPAKTTARAADIGIRILKGAKPADIPVEQADEFELTVSAKTARALGVKIPESVLARATRIVS